jgi:hypothetical protein
VQGQKPKKEVRTCIDTNDEDHEEEISKQTINGGLGVPIVL